MPKQTHSRGDKSVDRSTAGRDWDGCRQMVAADRASRDIIPGRQFEIGRACQRRLFIQPVSMTRGYQLQTHEVSPGGCRMLLCRGCSLEQARPVQLGLPNPSHPSLAQHRPVQCPAHHSTPTCHDCLHRRPSAVNSREHGQRTIRRLRTRPCLSAAAAIGTNSRLYCNGPPPVPIRADISIRKCDDSRGGE